MIALLIEIRDLLKTITSRPILTSLVLPIATHFFSMVMLIFAARSSVSAAKSSQAARDSIKNNTLHQMTRERYSMETYNARVSLRAFYKEYDNNAKKMMFNFKVFRESEPDFKKDKDRRLFITYFLHLFDLRQHDLMTDEDMHAYVNESDLEMLITISKPLEVVVHNALPGVNAMTLETSDPLFDYFQIFYNYYRERRQILSKDLLNNEKRKQLTNNRYIFRRNLLEYWKNWKESKII